MSKAINLSGLKTLLEPLIHLIDKKAERPDWNENDPSSPDYIENRPFYEATSVVEYTVDVINDFVSYDVPLPSFVDGETYNITWDGVEYSCVAYIAEAAEVPMIGNDIVADAGSTGGNGEPFGILVFEGQNFIFAETTGTHTLGISSYVIHKIDEKYLPEIESVGKEGTGDGAEIFNNYQENRAHGSFSHAEGDETTASGNISHAEGFHTIASADCAHAEGENTTASGSHAHAEGENTTASGSHAHAEGENTTASGECAHTEGHSTFAGGRYSHASGYNTYAYGNSSTVIGDTTKAFSKASFVAGSGTISDGKYSAVFGKYNINKKGNSETNRYVEDESVYGLSMSTSAYITEMVPNTKPVFDPQFGYIVDGYTRKTRNQLKVGDIYISELKDAGADANPRYICTYYCLVTKLTSTQIQSDKYQVIDMWDSEGNLITVGKGTGENNRSNAHTLDLSGNAWYAGDVYVGSTSGKNKDDGSKKLATEEYVIAQLNALREEILGGEW